MGKYDKYLAGLSAGEPSYGLPQSSTESVRSNAEKIEPGVYGETSPVGQRILENFGTAASGYFTPSLVASIPSAIKSIGRGYEALATSSKSPVLQGLLRSTKSLGKGFSEQDAALGVSRRVPVEGGKYAKFTPPERIVPTKQPKPITPAEPLPEVVPVQYPRETGSFLNYANAKLKGMGDRISPQELLDWKVKLQTDISNGTIPKFDKDTGRITTVYQQASDLSKRITTQFNKTAEPLLKGAKLSKGTIPTREGLNKAFSIAAKKEKATEIAKKGIKYAAGGGLAYQLGKKALGF